MISQGDVQSCPRALLGRYLAGKSFLSARGSWLVLLAELGLRRAVYPPAHFFPAADNKTLILRLARLSILRTGTAALVPSYRYPRLLDPYHSEPALCRAPLPRNPPIGDAFSQLRIAANTGRGTTLESSSRLPVTCTEIEDSTRRGHTLATANAILLFLQ
ncbi:hypothetical protein QC761_0049980 [Podospora bellae-mahoneyi]|uniref:Uncharacterized protein n=1 Tax=Podospora bellae-mahoneyi TaxID=2093777 RepID=A0ABR0FK38_9PEZI|nr:hypothetical protein QC761_0049980 [Podospora bellae-mahoneyi]